MNKDNLIKQRDETIARQANEIAELRDGNIRKRDIYGYVVTAPDDVPLVLMPQVLAQLKIWLHDELRDRAVAEVERDELLAELATLR